MKKAASLAALFFVALATSALARPVSETGFNPKFQTLDPSGRSGNITGALASGAFAAAQTGTTLYGGTYWAPDSARWEALEDSVWTFDTGVGSDLVGSSTNPYVNPHKQTGLHATMEGWTGFDNTFSAVTYFRRVSQNDSRWGTDVCVGTSAGLGGDYSFWCGVFPGEANTLCFATGQGYGDSWALCIGKDVAYTGGSAYLAYDYVNETEVDFDFSRVYVDTSGTGLDVLVAEYNNFMAGRDSLSLTPGVSLPSAAGTVTVKFCFRSDASYSDQDGFWPTTCGAFALDNIVLGGGIVDGPSTFETGDDGWLLLPSTPGPGGEWSNIVALADLDAPLAACDCALEDSVLVFEDLDDPYGHGTFQNNLAASPWIDLGPDGYNNQGLGKYIGFNHYSNLPLLNYVFAQFQMQWYPYLCPATGKMVTSPWVETGSFFNFGGSTPTCTPDIGPPTRVDFSGWVPQGAEQVRIAVGVISFCAVFSECIGMSNSSPWFDNVHLGVYGNPDAPLLTAMGIDLPQDSFPWDGTLSGMSPGRLDCNNVQGAATPEIGTTLGDTLVVHGGMDGAEVYVQFAVDPGPGVDSLGLAAFRSSVTFEETRGGQDWYSAQMDTAEFGGFVLSGSWMTTRIEGSPGFTGSDTDIDPNDPAPGGTYTRLVNDIFPDNLFTPGTHVALFYKTRYEGGTSWYVLPDTTGGNYFTMEVLPSSFHEDDTFNCVLYVDHFDGRGAEPFVKTALRNVLGTGGNNFDGDNFDTYNVRASSSQQASFGRPLGTQYGATTLQTRGYDCIIWNTGSLYSANLTQEDADVLNLWLTGTGYGDKSLYMSGDGIVGSVFREATWEPGTQHLMEDLAGVTFTCATYRNVDCPPGKPLDMTACVDLDPVAGAKVAGSLGRAAGDHLGEGNGCPELRSFDVLGVNTTPDYGVATPDELYNSAAATSGPNDYASVAIDAMDTSSLTYRVVTDGLSVHYRRDAADCSFLGDASPVTERFEEVLGYFGHPTGTLCEDRSFGGIDPPPPPTPVTALGAIAPNPLFAGQTGHIQFTMSREGRARVSIFDLNGRLVNTVFDGKAVAGENRAVWKGDDASGRRVASGVYFYRLTTSDGNFARQMVVLRTGRGQ